MTDPDDLKTLHALLDDGRAFGPEYGAGLANHLPMLLQALQSIGAPPARLRAFARTYATRLVPAAPPRAPLPRWQNGLGRPEAHAALLASFDVALASDGMPRTLAEALPMLMPGVAAGAFHGLLRTAHGAAAGHAGEVAAGLAYWASAHMPLALQATGVAETPTAAAAGWLTLAGWAGALLALPSAPGTDAPSIARRMVAAARGPGFAATAAALEVNVGAPGATLEALARLAAALYAATGNFTVLHVVTSCQAMRVLAPWQPNPAGAVRWYAQAVAAGLCAARLAPGALSGGSAPAPGDWPRLLEAAIASDDDHVAKLVQACCTLDTALGGADFRRAATRAIGERPGLRPTTETPARTATATTTESEVAR